MIFLRAKKEKNPNSFFVLRLIQQNKIYFTCLGLYFFIVGMLLLVQGKGDLVLFLNKNHHPLLDTFFKYCTYLGDGIFVVPLILFFLLFKNIFEGIVLLCSVLISFLVVQFLKIYIFPDMMRPLKYFPESVHLYFVEGVEIHGHNSFPSGHSAQAFSVFLVLTLFSKNKNWSVLFFLLAVLVTISRMYLAQHFFVDTYFGALIATILTLVTYTYFVNYTTLSEKERWKRGWIL
jgi:membrane-associated phospholipid phosphatase